MKLTGSGIHRFFCLPLFLKTQFNGHFEIFLLLRFDLCGLESGKSFGLGQVGVVFFNAFHADVVDGAFVSDVDNALVNDVNDALVGDVDDTLGAFVADVDGVFVDVSALVQVNS